MITNKNFQAARLQRSALALALGMGITGLAFAQTTTGAIFGEAPAAAGATVSVTGSTGITREVPVDSNGRYRIGNLPLGSYTVNLKRDGAIIDTRDNVKIIVGAGTTVSFTGAPRVQELEGVTVRADAIPVIDVSEVDSRTVITAEDLARLPLGRSAEAIALLAPGTVSGNGVFENTVSFGGAGVTENAYYINGFNTTDPLSALGGVGLPYGSIDQQQTYTGGYSAMYGRSDGGVINQVGKRGTNEWHFGGQVTWEPRSLASDPGDVYYPNKQQPSGYSYTNPDQAGTKYRDRTDNTSWNTTYSGYVGGPLIEDRLFMFVSGEAEKREGSSTSSSAVGSPNVNEYKYSLPKLYVKLDWNINDSNLLEYTHVKSNTSYSGALYDYDYATGTQGSTISGYPTSTKDANRYDIGKYTSFLTDDLTLSVLYGQSKTENFTTTPGASDLPYLSGVTNQDPAITGGEPIRNGTTSYVTTSPDAHSKTRSLRVDLDYTLGDHDITVGIDNQYYAAYDQGQDMADPGYLWIYSKSNEPTAAVNPTLGVGAPGGDGYYVQQYIFKTTTSMSTKQKAYYLQDRWQVTDNVLLSLGIRNDHFTNYNDAGKPYIDQDDQWAPRLGASWDVYGDSTFKVYGNLGRYYLALPDSVAIRGASSSTYTREYFTYTGIDPNTGEPTGLTPMGPGPVSANGEYGQTPDPNTFAASDLQSQYQDEAILGFDKTLGTKWAYGAKATYRRLGTAIDDTCDGGKIADKLTADGVDTSTLDIQNCYMYNPGETNTFLIADSNGGYQSVQMSQEDWGLDQGAKRKYYALDLYLEHPFDGKWQARLGYTFSRSWGNTEGQVRSDIGQDDISKTVDWDAAPLMDYSGGTLANDRRHQFKFFGAYQITPEWMVSATARIQSGTPNSCLGYYGADQSDPIGYGSYYHYCYGEGSGPGDVGTTPWTHEIDLGVQYRPTFADGKLAFGLNVFNLLNERQAISTDPISQDDVNTVSNTYGMGTYYQTPRYVRLSMSYDY